MKYFRKNQRNVWFNSTRVTVCNSYHQTHFIKNKTKRKRQRQISHTLQFPCLVTTREMRVLCPDLICSRQCLLLTVGEMVTDPPLVGTQDHHFRSRDTLLTQKIFIVVKNNCSEVVSEILLNQTYSLKTHRDFNLLNYLSQTINNMSLPSNLKISRKQNVTFKKIKHSFSVFLKVWLAPH